MNRNYRTAWKMAGMAFLCRLLLGGLFIGMQASSTEGSMAVLLDFPTLLVYWLLGAVGVHMHVIDTHDVRFFVIGLLVWSSLGFLLGWVVSRFRRRSHTVESS